MAASDALTRNKLTGSFTGTGQSAVIALYDRFNFTLRGTFVATVQLERSFDDGTTWDICSRDTIGTAAAYTAPVSLVAREPEKKVKFRLNCTAFTSGQVDYRLSQ